MLAPNNPDTSYASWRLESLKQAAADTHLDPLATAVQNFELAGRACEAATAAFLSEIRQLASAWQGSAASAATRNATSTDDQFRTVHQNAQDARSRTASYLQSAQHQKAQVTAIPDVDTSFLHAVSTGWLAGPAGIALAAHQQQQRYDHNQQQAARLVTQMDAEGRSQATAVQGYSWPSGQVTSDPPPRTLSPVPSGGGKRPGGDGGYGSVAPRGGGPGGGYSTPVSGPRMSGSDAQIADHGVRGGAPTRPGRPDQPAAPTSSGPSPAPAIPTTTAPHRQPTTSPQAGGAPTPPVPAAPTVPAAGTPSGPAGSGPAPSGPASTGPVPSGPAQPAGVPADVALLGGSGVLTGGGAAGARGPGRAGPGEADQLRPRAPEALGAGEPATRPGPRAGAVPGEELAAPREALLRSTAPGGFAAEPAVQEPGGFGGYPPRGAGARRGDDEQEAPVPDYLVETDDIWGDGAVASPPVIGE